MKLVEVKQDSSQSHVSLPQLQEFTFHAQLMVLVARTPSTIDMSDSSDFRPQLEMAKVPPLDYNNDL